MSPKKKKQRIKESRFFNRELSWLEFNDRVLRQGLSEANPLAERLKFLAIVSSNLDENYMIRVAGFMHRQAAGVRRRDPSGLTPTQQLALYAQRAHRLVAEQTEGIRLAMDELRRFGMAVLGIDEWTGEQREYCRYFFLHEVLPLLTPLATWRLDELPLLPGLKTCVAALLADAEDEPAELGKKSSKRVPFIVLCPLPAGLPRFVSVPAAEGTMLALTEDILIDNMGALYPETEIVAGCVFRITRDADVTIADDDAEDLLEAVEEAVLQRRRRMAVRLQIREGTDDRLKRWLVEWLELNPDNVYETSGPIDPTCLFELAAHQELETARNPEWPPQVPRDLVGVEDMFSVVRDRDVLLVHPYESFDPVVHFLEQAAEDRDVLAIKQCLYRTSGDSPIIRALEHAAERGKEVTVLVELKARFDESRNVLWARRLEDAGCNVIYGIVGYKTHSKALLVVRRESGRIRRYAHLATGNYNDKTARLYSDIGLLTADAELTMDVSAFFNLLTGYSESVGWAKILIAPTDLRRRFLEMIDREIQVSTPTSPGLIMAKVNSLEDPEIIESLYEASRQGVQILLNVRGICCLRPGVRGLSENIRVVSIVDRFLEHSRVFFFQNGGHEEVYLGSADWMVRNLSRRFELTFPIAQPDLARRVIHILQTYFNDNTNAWQLGPDGQYARLTGTRPLRAQEVLYQEAVDAYRAAARVPSQFQPLRSPREK